MPSHFTPKGRLKPLFLLAIVTRRRPTFGLCSLGVGKNIDRPRLRVPLQWLRSPQIGQRHLRRG